MATSTLYFQNDNKKPQRYKNIDNKRAVMKTKAKLTATLTTITLLVEAKNDKDKDNENNHKGGD